MQSELSKEDWQLAAHWVQRAFTAGGSKPGEPPSSKEYKQQENRVMQFLLAKAYPREVQAKEA